MQAGNKANRQVVRNGGRQAGRQRGKEAGKYVGSQEVRQSNPKEGRHLCI